MWRARIERATSMPFGEAGRRRQKSLKHLNGLWIANCKYCEPLWRPSLTVIIKSILERNPGNDHCPPQFRLNHCAISGLSIHRKVICRKSPMGIHLTLFLRTTSSPFGAELAWRWDCVIVAPRCPGCNTNIKQCGRERAENAERFDYTRLYVETTKPHAYARRR